MNKNRIVVFNRLTDSELADCSMFEELLENHYHKFVFFYTIMSDSDLLQHVDQISCKPVNKQELDIIITLDGISYKEFESTFYAEESRCYLYDKYDCDISKHKGNCIITIYKL